MRISSTPPDPDDSGAFYAERAKRRALRIAVVEEVKEVAATVSGFPAPLRQA